MDTIQLIDVREWSEYSSGHIAGPIWQLPLTPANLPWNSGVLRAQHSRLPRGIDIIVYCAAGGRSVAASLFLDSLGFTRIFNMTGGFNSWFSSGFESRSGGYGDHSGRWVRPSDTAVTVFENTGEHNSNIRIRGACITTAESIYIELHNTDGYVPVPPLPPPSEIEGLFRFTALDRFGLSLFIGDSMPLADTAGITFFPRYMTIKKNLDGFLELENMFTFVPGAGWRAIPFIYSSLSFHRAENVLRRWYHCVGTGLSISESPLPEQIDLFCFPNPFNSSVRISIPNVETRHASSPNIEIFDLNGRKVQGFEGSRVQGEIFDINGLSVVERSRNNREFIWTPDEKLGSGIYFIRATIGEKTVEKRAVYLK